MKVTRDNLGLLWAAIVVAIFLLWAGVGRAQVPDPARIAFRVSGNWTIEVAQASPVNGLVWVIESSGPLNGGAFIQTQAFPSATTKGCEARLDGSGACKRLTISVNKPVDQVGVLKLQFPGRTAGITSPVGASQAVMVLHEVTLDDFGLASLQLTVMGAQVAVFGEFRLNTYSTLQAPPAAPAGTVDGVPVDAGGQIKAGWHWFVFGPGKKLGVVGDPTDLLSLCARYPDGASSCAATGGWSLNVYIKQRGTYLFEAWDKTLGSAVYLVTGV